MRPDSHPRVAVCEMPDGLAPDDQAWRALVARLGEKRPDLCVLNELPFGRWFAAAPCFDPDVAAASVQAHADGLAALRALPSAVLSSRPVPLGGRLANEAFLSVGGDERAVHQKHYFPDEAGFFEQRWFATARRGFGVVAHGALRVGVLLCTELMFTEWARHYRRQGANVIAVPRASGLAHGYWHAAARMAAIVSGCYVVSSNRVSARVHSDDQPFGGGGFAFAPDGELLGMTSREAPMLTVAIDLDRVAAAQRGYPCNVRELEAGTAPTSLARAT